MSCGIVVPMLLIGQYQISSTRYKQYYFLPIVGIFAGIALVKKFLINPIADAQRGVPPGCRFNVPTNREQIKEMVKTWKPWLIS
jgi:hypothetical protein